MLHKARSSVPQIKLCVTKNRQTIAKSAAFCNFCVFAGKNDVYLVNQSCKDGKSKALCHIFPHKTLKTLHFPTKKRLHLPVQPHFYPTKLLFVNLLENNHRPGIYTVFSGMSILFKGIPTVITRLCPGSSICNYNPFFTGSRFRHNKWHLFLPHI